MSNCPRTKAASLLDDPTRRHADSPRGFCRPMTNKFRSRCRSNGRSEISQLPKRHPQAARLIASQAHRSINSMRVARMGNSKSTGVATAWRSPDHESPENGCNSVGRGSPKSRSHALRPKPMTQERPPSISQIPRREACRKVSAKRRTDSRSLRPGFIVRTKKNGGRAVRGVSQRWERGDTHPRRRFRLCIGSESIECSPVGASRKLAAEI